MRGGIFSFIMEWIYKYISVAAIIGTLGFSIRYLIQKKIDSYFNKKLETYKQELTIITENAKYDISKKMFDFEAYASKKHAVYPEIYRLIFEILTELVRLRYKFDVELKLQISTKVLSGDDLFSLFYEKILHINNKISDAYDYFNKNELYLSRNASTAFEEAMSEQSVFMKIIISSFHTNLKNANWKDPDFLLIKVENEDYDKVSEKVRVLKEIIYEELSYTHFKEMEQKEEALSQ